LSGTLGKSAAGGCGLSGTFGKLAAGGCGLSGTFGKLASGGCGLSVSPFVQASSLLLDPMSTRTKTATRLLAILKFPKNKAPEAVIYARSILRSMTGNPSFPSPHPSLSTLEAATDALAEAEGAARSRALGTATIRDERRQELKGLLEQLCAHVQARADANHENAASIIESAGMYVKKGAAPVPGGFRAKHGKNSGDALVIAPSAGDRAAYEFAYSIDGMKTWVTLEVTQKATVTVHGLTPGSTVYFRYRARTSKKGWGDLSDPIGIRVT
jgi:hypothetical protein